MSWRTVDGVEASSRAGADLDLDLRLVRYFTAVAEHGSFGRAADALHLAQPSLSRQVQQLERRIGTRLLDRSARGSQLTDAGRAFLPRARALLRSAERAAAEARSAAEPATITIGSVGYLVITPAVAELRARHPTAQVRTVGIAYDEPHAALVDHRVDVVVARGPLLGGPLDVVVLSEVPRVLLLPVTHRLAGRTSVTLADFADEPLVRFPHQGWNAFWRIDPRPDGRPAPEGPLVEAPLDRFELIASGQALAITVPGAPGTGFRADLTTVAIEGIAPSQVVLASRPGERRLLVQDFRAIASRLLRGGAQDAA